MQEREVDVLESNIRDSLGLGRGSHSVEAGALRHRPHYRSFPSGTIDMRAYYSHTTNSILSMLCQYENISL